MKTLINKINPQIRISAPDITLENLCYYLWTDDGDCFEFWERDWNFVEEESVDLEKEIEKKWNECDPIDEGMGAEYANIAIEQFDEICKYFYELGIKEATNESNKNTSTER